MPELPTIMAISASLLLVLSILYYTLKTGISPMPSSAKARHCLLTELEASLSGQELGQKRQTLTITDLGSGWGHLVIPLAMRYPQYQITGYELSWLPFTTCRLLKLIFQLENLTLHRKNFLKAELPPSDIFTCFLFTEAMQQLSQQLKRSQRDHSLMISIFFALPDYKPDRIVRLNDLYHTPVYVYPLSAERTRFDYQAAYCDTHSQTAA